MYTLISRDDFQINRSLARVTWHIEFRGVFICTADTRKEAVAIVERLIKAVR